MSLTVDVILLDLHGFAAISERKFNLAGEALSFDPPRYAFRDLDFDAHPIARHVIARLPDALKMGASLTLPETTVLDWRANRIRSETRDELGHFVRALIQNGAWAILIEGTGTGSQEITPAAGQDVCLLVEQVLQSPLEPGLVVIHSP